MHWSALPHQRRSASKNTAFKFNTSIYSMHSAEEYTHRNESQRVHGPRLSDTEALLHGNASIPAGLEERLGSRLISHYRRLMLLPGAYKSTRPSRFHVRSGKLSCISIALWTLHVCSICLWVWMRWDRVCIYWSAYEKIRDRENHVQCEWREACYNTS